MMHAKVCTSRRRRTALVLASATLLFAACDTGGESPADDTTTHQDTTDPDTTAAGTAATDESLVSGPVGVVELVQQVEPSVVSVATSNAAGPIGGGSGVIVRSDGVIVTNAHVVANADEIEVAFADGVRAPARLHATDELTDLAVLVVDRTDLPAAELADHYPDVGELAVAVGNPLGFENTVTSGIISGLQRSLPSGPNQVAGPLVDLVQTDAAISPGNSGGALVDAGGELIGITVAYLPPQSGAVSLGFAIPAPTVASVVDDLLDDGVVQHAYFGVRATTLTPQITEQLATTATSGIAVIDVEPGTPAADAGLEPGDVVTALADEPVDDLGEFLVLLRRAEPGDVVAVEVQRGGEQLELDVVLGTRPR